MAELMAQTPIIKRMNEGDEIYKICSILGSPTAETWKAGLELAERLHFVFPDVQTEMGVHG